MNEFNERLGEALNILEEIGANYCGDLSYNQAKRFHAAVEKLLTLELETYETQEEVQL